MLSGVPNFAFTVGYTNASWTLKADLTASYVCRLLNHMRRRGYAECMPADEDPASIREPLLNLNSGLRAALGAGLPLARAPSGRGGCTRTMPWMCWPSSSAGSTTGSCGSRAVVAPPPGHPGRGGSAGAVGVTGRLGALSGLPA